MQDDESGTPKGIVEEEETASSVGLGMSSSTHPDTGSFCRECSVGTDLHQTLDLKRLGRRLRLLVFTVELKLMSRSLRKMYTLCMTSLFLKLFIKGQWTLQSFLSLKTNQ